MDYKIPAKIKTVPEDFIVEELREDEGVCEISKEKHFGEKPTKIPETDKPFLLCDLEKYDIDHFRAMKELASSLRKGSDAIGYAGSKDKKAWTCQRISIFEPDFDVIQNFSHPNLYLKNFKWFKRKIKLGYLKGNRFRIVLRDIDKKDAIKVANDIRKTPFFPNYFGSQRFGSVRGNNVKIGKLLLKRDFKEAIWTMLTDISDKERDEVIQARLRLRKEKDLKKATEYFPRYLKLERSLIDYLARNPDDYVGALRRVERKSVLMLVNSVQSKLFNDILEYALAEEIDFKQKGQQRIPLFGYKGHFDEGRLGEIEQEVLKNHQVKLEDFDIREFPYLRLKGELRNAIVPVDNLDLEIADDEIHGNNKIILKFDLPSGVYATTFLENFFELRE